MSDTIGFGIRSQDANIPIPIWTTDPETLDKNHEGVDLPVLPPWEQQRYWHVLAWRENTSVNAVHTFLFPQSTNHEAVAKEAVMPDACTSMLVFRRMLEGIPTVEKLMARAQDWGLMIWIIVNNSTEDIRYQIYDKEWKLMQRFPGLGVTFDLIDREDRPLEQLVTFQDIDSQFTFREFVHAV